MIPSSAGTIVLQSRAAEPPPEQTFAAPPRATSPITAILWPLRVSGSTPLFFSSTDPFCAIVRSSFRCSGVETMSIGAETGLSNRPIRNAENTIR
jgi:hypothetical protein